jgi:hypothetical protein
LTIPDAQGVKNRGPAELRWLWCGWQDGSSCYPRRPALDDHGTPARKTCVCVTVLPQWPQPTTIWPPRADDLTGGPLEESGPPASPSSSCRPSSVLLGLGQALLEVLDQTGLQQRLLAAAQPICCQPSRELLATSLTRHRAKDRCASTIVRSTDCAALLPACSLFPSLTSCMRGQI